MKETSAPKGSDRGWFFETSEDYKKSHLKINKLNEKC